MNEASSFSVKYLFAIPNPKVAYWATESEKNTSVHTDGDRCKDEARAFISVIVKSVFPLNLFLNDVSEIPRSSHSLVFLIPESSIKEVSFLRFILLLHRCL